jgi:hypothetical protein
MGKDDGFEVFEDSKGHKQVRFAGVVVEGELSDRGRAERGKALADEATPTEADMDRVMELRDTDSEFEAVQARMRELSADLDPAVRSRIDRDPRVFLEEYQAIKTAMADDDTDRGRLDKLAALRAQLKEEDEATGCRQTTRRWELVERIAALHAGGGR